ncbi:peroxiredoxin family protein [Mucilaginibacter sp. X4EP1]|jgi:peroxiredoxin|uniref:peroxiredoxin family protein n=1 Tax=Mucilaginibacter sp. X4EP1 TaxID=2723092 RepID=UPI002169955B|nr:TlpA disulfide reductase family protein [Mucilaginibacter sp. X4EP1]MCS3812683.1 peroxiredoxin [Mucilaginibacter sp. X4EP1]
MKKYFLITQICIMIIATVNTSGATVVKPSIELKPHSASHRFMARKTDQDDSELLNKPAPGFELTGLDGKNYSLKNLKGKIVVLNFWFIACKPCVNEMPVLNSIKKKYDPKKVVFLALSLDSKSAVNAFLQNHQFNYVMLPDAAPVHRKYHLNAYPTSIVIDARGIISFVQIGGPDINENLQVAINSALKSM